MRFFTNILSILLLSLSYFIYSSLINVSYYFAIATQFFFIFIFLLIIKFSKNKLSKEKKYFYKMIIIPELAIFIYSIFPIIFTGNFEILMLKKYLAKGLLFLSTSIGACAFFEMGGKKSINILFFSMFLNYLFYIFLAFSQEGLSGIIQYVMNNFNGIQSTRSVLEAHEVTFCLSLLMIYYFLEKPKDWKSKLLICLLFFILGFKRIAIFGVLLLVIMNLLLSKKENKTIYIISGIGVFALSFLWMYFVKYNVFSIISQKFDIDFMGRIKLYSAVKNQFSLSPFFIGHGIGYISYWGELNTSLTNSHALHSSIIEMYVDLGFFAYFIYIFNRVCMNSLRILKKVDKRNARNYFLIILYVMVLWATDNITNYLNFLFVTNVILLNIIFKGDALYDKRKETIEIDKR